MPQKIAPVSRYCSHVVREKRYTALLPFLYQTRTILKPATQRLANNQHQPAPNWAKAKNIDLGRYRDPSTNIFHKVYNARSDRPANERAHDDIPFQDVPIQEQPSQSQTGLPEINHSHSTITGSERAVFDSIFRSLVRNEAEFSAPEDVHFDKQLTIDGRPAETLEEIFDAAIKTTEATAKGSGLKYPKGRPNSAPADSREQQSFASRGKLSVQRTPSGDFPPVLQLSLQRAKKSYKAQTYRRVDLGPRPEKIGRVGIEPERRIEEPRDAYEQLVDRVRKRDMERITALFAAAKNDLQVWDILKWNVFRPMENLNELMKEQKIGEGAIAPTKEKREDPSPDEVTITTENTVRAISANAAGPYLSLDAAPTGITFPKYSVHPLAILQTNYAEHLLTALQIFRKHYPTSPYAISLLTRIKDLGTLSYVLGSSTALYNELIYIRWMHYRDPHSCADLVAEMSEQGIPMDGYTRAIYMDASKTKRLARRGKKIEGPVARAWWRLQGVRAGMSRWDFVHNEAVRRWKERKAREEEEARALLQLDEGKGEDGETEP